MDPGYKSVSEGKDVSIVSELFSASGNVAFRFRPLLSLVLEVLEVLDLMPGRNRKNDPALHSLLDLVQFEQGRLIESPIGDSVRRVTLYLSDITPILAFQMTILTCLAVSYVSSTRTQGTLAERMQCTRLCTVIVDPCYRLIPYETWSNKRNALS